MKILCIYHANCADGFGAAWAVREALRDQVEFHAGFHGAEPPDVVGRDVVMVDFSYKRPVIEKMQKQAESILILDHHIGTQKELAGFESPGDTWQDYIYNIDVSEGCPVKALFDMERSGAGIAWDFFHGTTRPPLIDHIEDRDLWRFKLPGTKEISAALFSYPYGFDIWSGFMYGMTPDELRAEGEPILRKQKKDIAEFIDVAASRMVIAGHDVPCLNAPYFWSSDAGHILAQGEKFAACYWDQPDGRHFSLRSSDDGMDVSEIAALFGGGGHKHAAGFNVSHGTDVSNARGGS